MSSHQSSLAVITKRKNMMAKHILIFLSVIAVVFTVIVGYAIFVDPQFRIHKSLRVYPEAELLFEEIVKWGGGSERKNLYYVTQDSLADVEQYYAEFLPPLILSEDPYGQWFMTGFKTDGSQLIPNTSSTFLGHGSFCPDHHDFECVSVSLVDTAQPNLYRLAISSPSNFYYLTPPPEFSSIPQEGTLIIYGLWIFDW